MRLSKEEIIQFVKEENIKSVHLAFCDVFGNEKNIVIMPEELKIAFSTGIAFNASEVKNFGEGVYRDLLLHPEPETFSDMPWRPENDRAVRMFCSMTYADGKPFDRRGTKSLLIEAIEAAEQAGFEFYFATELEFYLFELDAHGQPTKIPYDNAGMLDIPPEDKCESIRRKIYLALEQMGVFPNNAYHEEGPGQNKISFGFSDPLTAGNNVTTLKAIIKNEAANNGCAADFSPKPLDGQPGNGFHINISVRSNDGRGDSMVYAIAGILNRIPEITAFLNPSEESYKRLAHGGAPKYVSWTSENREQLFRIPEAVGTYRKAELRSSDSTVNPYLAFALLIFAGLEGIEKQLDLPFVSNFDLETADAATLAQLTKLPATLEKARALAAESEFVKSHLSEDIISFYLGKKPV